MKGTIFSKAVFQALLLLLSVAFLLSGCSIYHSNKLGVSQLILYDWEGDMPQEVIDAFKKEYGIDIDYKEYVSQEEAIENMREGRIYDVVVMDSRFIPILVKENLVAPLDYSNLPNAKNISPAFRDLIYDPGNQFTIPYTWGTTALLVSSKIASEQVTSWADLWDVRYQHRVALWKGTPREVVAIALKTLGYSANSENPLELEAALKKLLELKPGMKFLDNYFTEHAAPAFIYGNIVLAAGYSYDYSACQDAGLDVAYVYPSEGALLWGDVWVVPLNSPRKEAAEAFLNFLLRPEISAMITNNNYYATTNQAALALVEPQILEDPSIFPPAEVLETAEIILPLSLEGQTLYDTIWARFLAAIP